MSNAQFSQRTNVTTDHRFGFAAKVLADEHGADGETKYVVGVGDAGPPRLLVAFRPHDGFAKDLSGVAKRFR